MKNKNPKHFIMNLVDTTKPDCRYKKKTSFQEWQKTARKKLSNLLGLEYISDCEPDFEITDITDCGVYTDTCFQFQSEPGYYVPCHILIPKHIARKTPVIFCLQGHSTGMHISIGKPIYKGDEETIAGGDRNYAQLAVALGYCAVAVEQRYMGECGGDENGPGCLSKWSDENINAMATLLYGRTAIGERIHDLRKAIDVVLQHFDCVDERDIIVTGNSGGGTTTFYAACLDERIRYAMPSCSVCTFRDSIINLIHCGCNYVPGIARYFDMCDLAGLIAPRNLIIVAGKEDIIFPIEGVKKTYEFAKELYQIAGAEEKIALVIGNEGHKYYAKAAFDALDGMRKKGEIY